MTLDNDDEVICLDEASDASDEAEKKVTLDNDDEVICLD